MYVISMSPTNPCEFPLCWNTTCCMTYCEAFLTQQNGCCKAMTSLPDNAQTTDKIWMLIQCRYWFWNDIDSKMSGRYLDCVAKRHDLGMAQSKYCMDVWVPAGYMQSFSSFLSNITDLWSHTYQKCHFWTFYVIFSQNGKRLTLCYDHVEKTCLCFDGYILIMCNEN